MLQKENGLECSGNHPQIRTVSQAFGAPWHQGYTVVRNIITYNVSHKMYIIEPQIF